MQKINTKFNIKKPTVVSNSTPKSKAKAHVQYQRNHIRPTLEQEDDEVNPKDMFLGYFTEHQQQQCVTIPIDSFIKEPMYYRQVVNAITQCNENDVIEFEINSPGGSLAGLCSLLSAMQRTPAEKTALINGDCHSAASMLALSCDAVVVSPYASMLVHNASAGTIGKIADMRSHMDHLNNFTDRLFSDTYRGFLSEKEIKECLGGKELWLNAEDIVERLQARAQMIQEWNKDKSGDDCNGDCNGCDCKLDGDPIGGYADDEDYERNPVEDDYD
jgi:ATP-dependent protease ClpP protease subunit